MGLAGLLVRKRVDSSARVHCVTIRDALPGADWGVTIIQAA